MSRLVVLTCLALLLICPFVCLAETVGERCGRADGDVCESMALGAVVADSTDAPTSPHELAPCLDEPFPTALPSSASLLVWSRLACDRMPRGKPLDARRRRSLLQSFLF